MTEKDVLGHGLVEGVKLGVFKMNDPKAIDPGYTITEKFWQAMRRSVKQNSDPAQAIILAIVDMCGKNKIEEKRLEAIAIAVNTIVRRYSAEGMQ